MNRLPPLFLAILASIALVASACGGSAASPTPNPSPTPGPVTTPDEAIAAVIAREPRLAGITALDPDLIGQGSFYEVMPASGVGVFVVKVTVGWGDCPAGCISRHEWLYAVGPDGTVTLQSEGGDAIPPDAWPSPGGDGRTGIMLIALRGPICPVERIPPDPACASQPVPGAVVVIRDVAGDEVKRVTLDADGIAFVELAAGTYTLEPQPAEGTMAPAGAQSVTVIAGIGFPVILDYDTGIR